MFCTPHLTHAASAQQLDEGVASHFTSLGNGGSQLVKKARKNDCDGGRHNVGKSYNQEQRGSGWRLVVGISRYDESNRSHCSGGENSQGCLTERVRHNENEKCDPKSNPARANVNNPILGKSGSFDQSDTERPDHFEYQTQIEHQERREFSSARQRIDRKARAYREPHGNKVRWPGRSSAKDLLTYHQASSVMKEQMCGS